MSAYLIIDIEIHDPDLYAEYVRRVPATVKQFGGRYLARGGRIEAVAGGWNPQRIILIEFPSSQHVRRWLSSEEYRVLAELREKSAKGKAIIVDGIDAQDGPVQSI